MRELKSATKEYGQTFATDEQSGGANHHYAFKYQPTPGGPIVEMGSLKFQSGFPAEAGVNGVSDEQVLLALIDHIEGLQRGNSCHQNYNALMNLKNALDWIRVRPVNSKGLGAEQP